MTRLGAGFYQTIGGASALLTFLSSTIGVGNSIGVDVWQA